MSYSDIENSVDSGEPIELYLFTYNGMTFSYTSSQRTQIDMIDGQEYSFEPEYIRRDTFLKLGDSGGNVETCNVIVSRANSIALLYTGAPPELDKVRLQIFRKHGEVSKDIIKILDGTTSQVTFNGSEVTLTITIERLLNRNIPIGTLSYNCQCAIYDEKCGLRKEDWGVKCYLTKIDGLTLYSYNLKEKPSGWFTDGFIQMGGSFRGILKHEDDHITLKYPLNQFEKQGSFMAYAGCNYSFEQCHKKFNNAKKFSGIPYQQPYDVFVHPVDNSPPYWVGGDGIKLIDSHGEIHPMGV